MSPIHDFITVDVPFERVPALAERYLNAHRRDGGEAIVPLRMQAGDLLIERNVQLDVVPSRRYPGYEIMTIRWHADGGGPYPAFAGTLSAQQEGTTYCRLDLDGEYEPPGSVAGMAFDAIVGHRIAQAAVEKLLQTFKDAFEKIYAEEAIVS